MQERKDPYWEGVLKRSKMSPRQIDVKPIIAAVVVSSLGGFLGTTWSIEFAKEISDFSAQMLQPPVTYALQFSATGLSTLLGIGIGFSLERYLAEGAI